MNRCAASFSCNTALSDLVKFFPERHSALNVLRVSRLLVAPVLFQDFDGNALC